MPDSNAPAGFIAFEKKGVRGFVRDAARDKLVEAFCGKPPVDETANLAVGGRGGLRRIETPMGPAIVRTYRRGGFLRHFVKETYLRNRPIKEFRVHLEAHRRGVPVPEVLGVA